MKFFSCSNSSEEREAVETQEVQDGFQRIAGCPSVQETGSLNQQASILPDEKSKQVEKPGFRNNNILDYAFSGGLVRLLLERAKSQP